jgi:NADPH2:quinone reductase
MSFALTRVWVPSIDFKWGTHMRAIVCHTHGGPEVMQYETVSDPTPAEGELLVRAEAIGVNFVDTMRRSGKHPTAPEPPFTPGIELCGRVVALGPGVTGLHKGQRVLGRCVTHGSYAELVRVESRFAVPCPESLPAEEGAALFVNGQTAYHALVTMGHVRPGEAVLITAAAGGVGTCAVQMAKLLGARVLAAAGTTEKVKLAANLGADAEIDYSLDDWPRRVLKYTDGKGADLILESVGGDIFQTCLGCWAPRGRMVVFGRASGRAGVVTGDELLFGNRTVCGLAVGLVIEDTKLLRTSMQQLFEWLDQSRLRLIVGETHPLQDAALAHQRLEQRQTCGKIVLVP